jgi:hypothetical protein
MDDMNLTLVLTLWTYLCVCNLDYANVLSKTIRAPQQPFVGVRCCVTSSILHVNPYSPYHHGMSRSPLNNRKAMLLPMYEKHSFSISYLLVLDDHQRERCANISSYCD